MSHDGDFNVIPMSILRTLVLRMLIQHQFGHFSQPVFFVYRNSNAERNIAGAEYCR
jgi:hypothetical protein